MKIRIPYFILFLLCCSFLATGFTSCADEDTGVPTDKISLGKAVVCLTSLSEDLSGMDVQLRNIQTGSVFVEKTNEEGVAVFTTVPGNYEALVSSKRIKNGQMYIYNGTSGQLTVLKNQSVNVSIPMHLATISQLVIKELYCGGCMKDDGVTAFFYDKYVSLYNNSDQPASLENLCFGMASPANAQATNYNYTAEGHLNYENEGFIPLWNGIWYFPQTLTVAPYSEIIVNIHGAINNTLTVSQSVSFANPDYYCMFDPESGYINQSYCPTPSEVIPTSHYLKAVVYGQGNAWPFSNSSPTLVLFQTHGISPSDFAHNVENYWYDGGNVGAIKRCVKIPNSWIVDAVEVFSNDYPTQCVKRLTADVDAGYVWLTNKKGHSLHRHIDKEATEASGGHTVYKDTNNSSNDFYERDICSLRDQ